MGQVKINTSWIPTQNMFRLAKAHPPWEMHPDWIQALKSLDSYNLWICEVVMPIVFQWIEEHKAEVYKEIPEEQKDDVGVVVAKAFEIVSSLSAYKKGAELVGDYESEVKEGKFDFSKINPLWQKMSSALDEATRNTKSSQDFAILGDTIKNG